ncbi:hypothetical protein BDV96DRAFT_672288, partial [Lophiotrema nucula]
PEDSAGLIHKHAFIISTSCLYGLAILPVLARFAILIHMRRRVGLDDIFVIVALGFVTVSIAVVHTKLLDLDYLLEAMTRMTPGVMVPADLVERVYQNHDWEIVSEIMLWCSAISTKFSFLFFFRKLIWSLRTWRIWWWIVLAFTIITWAYGIAIYFMLCPYYHDPRILLSIPIAIVWKIRVPLPKKIALASSLGLTFFVIVITLIRITNMRYNGQIDVIWPMYWQVIGAEVGVFMAAAITFRSLFVASDISVHARRHEAGKVPELFFNESFRRRFERRVTVESSGDLESSMTGSRLPQEPELPQTWTENECHEST